jgi:hypothetical protein
MMRTMPVILCIDVEPDERYPTPDAAKDWEGFAETFEFFSALRPRLAEATGAPARLSWFFRMDPQIEVAYGSPDWVVRRRGEIIEQLERAGDELGLHTHAWRWSEDSHCWVADHGNQQWISHCLRVSFAAYRRAFGRACASFRFGDHWMNNEAIDLLESLGAQFDLTIEPGRIARPAQCLNEPHTGSLPDYVSAPRRPYRPSRRDFRTHHAGHERGLWAIPLSTGKEPGRFTTVKRAAETLGIDLRKRNDTVPLNLALDAPLFRALMDSWLAAAEEKYLALVVRADACLPARFRANVAENMNSLLSHPLAGRFQFSRPAEAVRLLT